MQIPFWNHRAQQKQPSRSYRPLLEVLEARWVPSTLHVGTGVTEYHTIQAAVDAAAPGSTIQVDPGTYQEQVKITKDDIQLVGRGQKSIIEAPAVMTSPKAIVEISGTNVAIEGFTIEGNGAPGVDTVEAGIRVDGGGFAIIDNNHITAIRDNPLNNFQNELGILVGRNDTTDIPNDVTTGSALITDNRIDNYQKGGISIENKGSHAVIDGNTILGTTNSVIAQNGIQVSDGADACVTENDVEGNLFTGPGPFVSSGILLSQPGAVQVADNTVVNNDVGIFDVSTTGAEIERNTISGGSFGIYALNSTKSAIERNTVSRTGTDGIDLDGTTASEVDQNKVSKSGSGDGIALFDAATGNDIHDNKSTGNGDDGIFVDSGSTGNRITDNTLKDNKNLDAEDRSTGTGTAHTGNFWDDNRGKTANPSTLLND